MLTNKETKVGIDHLFQTQVFILSFWPTIPYFVTIDYCESCYTVAPTIKYQSIPDASNSWKHEIPSAISPPV